MVVATYECPRCQNDFICVVQYEDKLIIYIPVNENKQTNMAFVRSTVMSTCSLIGRLNHDE